VPAFGSQITVTFNETSASYGGSIGTLTYDIDAATSWETNLVRNSTSFNLKKLIPRKSFSLKAYSTCSTKPTLTDITYKILPKFNGEFPDWISLNETIGNYEGTPPVIKNETAEYSFILEANWTTISAGSTQQEINLTVSYSTGPTSASTLASFSVQLAAAVGGIASIGIALASGSPPTAFYSILHLLQMIIIVLMIDPFIPDSITSFIENQGFSLLNFNFIPPSEIPIINVLVNWVDYQQTNAILNSMGIESGSSFINNLPLMLSLLGIMILHFILKYVFICGTKSGIQKGK